jgi:hypothetical protein
MDVWYIQTYIHVSISASQREGSVENLTNTQIYTIFTVQSTI